jgi:hypothetical protein
MKLISEWAFVGFFVLGVGQVVGAENTRSKRVQLNKKKFEELSFVEGNEQLLKKEKISGPQELGTGPSEEENDEELEYFYLNYALTLIGIRQFRGCTLCCASSSSGEEEKQKMQDRGACGNPDVPFLFPRDFNFNSVADDEGRSFLTRAIAFNSLEIARMLIKRGARVNCPDKCSILPLQEALMGEIITGNNGHYHAMIQYLKSEGALLK